MATIKRKSKGGGGANWMDTYGDMVTLLLCFFVLLYSMSTIDQEKWMLIVQSFNKDAEISIDDSPRGPDGTHDAEMGDDMPMTKDEVNEMQEMIMDYLADYAASVNESLAESQQQQEALQGGASGAESGAGQNQGQGDIGDQIAVVKGDGWFYMKLPDEVLFRGDSDVLTTAGQEALSGIIPILEEGRLYINQIEVSGHTASAQGTYNARKDRKLASGRAAEVAAYLQENSTIQPARIVSQGYGQWMPIASNEAEEDRSKNRRVELFISFMDEEIDNPFAGSIEQYYTQTEQENPDPLADVYAAAE